MNYLDKLRREIDNIDREIIRLFEMRMEIAIEIGHYKEKNNMKIYDKSREDKVIEKNISHLKNENFKEAIVELTHCIMNISKDIQKKEKNANILECKKESKDSINKIEINSKYFNENKDIKLGFQGVLGSFSEQALMEYFGKCDNIKSFKDFEDVLLAIKNNEIDYGILPIENSSTGGIAEVYDLLRKYGFYIVGEKVIKVEHHLLGVKGAKLEDIQEVYSHHQALQQSSEFLKDYNKFKLIPFSNTATSAEYIKDKNSKTKGAVASKRAAELYGLDIIKSNINHNKDNYTRFIVIGKKLEYNNNSNKISIVVTVPHKPGMLYKTLSIFAKNNINMMKIESRPIIGKPWEYFFYIDFEGNLNEGSVKAAINEIQEDSSYYKLLGNYKGDSSIRQ